MRTGKINQGRGSGSKFPLSLPQRVGVRREGKDEVIDAVELVVGDVILMRAGDKVPADVRIVEAEDAVVDASSLTGEAEREVSAEMTADSPLETKNLAFCSTLVVTGKITGIVVKTGDDTVAARLAQQAVPLL